MNTQTIPNYPDGVDAQQYIISLGWGECQNGPYVCFRTGWLNMYLVNDIVSISGDTKKKTQKKKEA